MSYKKSDLQDKLARFRDEDRANKHRIETTLTEQVFDGSRGDEQGCVLSLTGPDLERHVRVYEPWASWVIAVERDRKLAAFLRGVARRERAAFSAHVMVWRGDVFDYQHRAHLPPIVLADLDFNQGWTESLELRIASLMERWPRAWFRVTFNARSRHSFDGLARVRPMTQQIPYRALAGATSDPMVTAQFGPAGR